MSPRLKTLTISVILLGLLVAGGPSQADDKTWRSGWIAGIPRELDKIIALAKELDFNALITAGNDQFLEEFIAKTRKHGLESYYWLAPQYADKKTCEPRQVMTEEDQRLLEKQQKQQKEKTLYKNGFQGGGEPLPGQKNVLMGPIPCHHDPAVLQATKDKVKDLLTKHPHLTGIALDLFGYQNYKDCHCPTSLKAFEAYRKKHPQHSKEDAWQKFSLESLVDFQNQVCDYARKIRPGIKTTVHVWPTYLPEPVYGNRLDLDYCCQTVAWFFKPYWSDEKIRTYTQNVVSNAKTYHQRQQGIPFVGFFDLRGEYQSKLPERLKHELEIIMKHNPSHSLSTFRFNDMVNNPKAVAVLKAIFKKYPAVK